MRHVNVHNRTVKFLVLNQPRCIPAVHNGQHFAPQWLNHGFQDVQRGDFVIHCDNPQRHANRPQPFGIIFIPRELYDVTSLNLMSPARPSFHQASAHQPMARARRIAGTRPLSPAFAGQEPGCWEKSPRSLDSPHSFLISLQIVSGSDRNIWTASGENWRPDSLAISSRAAENGRALRYGRSDVMASNVSATEKNLDP